MDGFTQLGLSPEVIQVLDAMGFEEPTEVQKQTVPAFLAGSDLIVQAQTGTGKTAAFGIPIVEKIDPRKRHLQALVLTPTRELALQVSVALTQIGKAHGISVVAVYGGASYSHQIRAFRGGVQIVVATPGRLVDLMERGIARLDQVEFVVLDEADEMLDMGFEEEVERILGECPEERQTALFSATLKGQTLKLARSYLRDPQRVTLSTRESVTVPEVSQAYYVVPRPFKIDAITRLLDVADPRLALVFCATKQMTDQLAQELQGAGYQAQSLHGDMSQGQREKVMEACRAGRVELLIATDVAARGLDIPEVSHVINFDIPQDSDRYVHRIGRTARAGRAGEALTIISPQEFAQMRAIERAIGVRIPRKELPTVAEMEQRDRARMISQVEQELENDRWTALRPLVEDLAQTHDPLDLAAASLGVAFGPKLKLREIPRVSTDRPVAPPRGNARRAPTSRPPYRDGTQGRTAAGPSSKSAASKKRR